MTTNRGGTSRWRSSGGYSKAGYQALWAGGCVRDLILGQTPADYDVATDATPEQVMAVLPFRAVTVGISFGVVRVRHPRRPGVEVEVATFRSDGAYVDGRRPESVVFSSPELDAARRDFTINGMFMDPLTDELIDYVGGHADLKNHLLRAIGDPEARFREDKLRVLAAIRLAARFQLQIEPATLAALKSMAGQVVTVSAERIAQELRRMLVHESRAQAMDLALDTGLVAAILPPLVPMKGLFQGKPMQPEGDLWDHTMLVSSSCPPSPALHSPSPRSCTMSASRRPGCFTRDGTGFHNHEQIGAADRRPAVPRLETLQRRARADHLARRFPSVPGRGQEAPRVEAQADPGGAGDRRTAGAPPRRLRLASTGNTEHVDYCQHYLKVQPAGPINPPPLITGHDLVRLGLEPGAPSRRFSNRSGKRSSRASSRQASGARMDISSFQNRPEIIGLLREPACPAARRSGERPRRWRSGDDPSRRACGRVRG